MIRSLTYRWRPCKQRIDKNTSDFFQVQGTPEHDLTKHTSGMLVYFPVLQRVGLVRVGVSHLVCAADSM